MTPLWFTIELGPRPQMIHDAGTRRPATLEEVALWTLLQAQVAPLRCLHCGYEWYPLKPGKKPVVCAACKRRRWDEPPCYPELSAKLKAAWARRRAATPKNNSGAPG